MTRPLFVPALLALAGCVHAAETRASVRDELDRLEARARPVTGASSGAVVDPAEGSEGLARNEMIAAYLGASPELATFDAELEARLARIDVAGSLEAPELMIQAWNVPFRRPYALDDASMWMAIVSQRFEPRGVRRDRVREASAEARAVVAERATVALAVASEASSDHAALAQLDAVLAARTDAGRAYAALVTASESLVASGRGDSRMLAEAVAMRAEVEAAIVGTRARRAALARSANVRMGRDPETELVVRVDETPVDVARLRERLTAHPALASVDARREAASARVDAATHAERRPSISAGVGFFEEPHAGVGYGLQVGLTLPWIGGRARAERRLAEAEASRVDADHAASERSIALSVERAVAETFSADAAIRAIDESSLPALENASRATTSGLASGATSIRDVVLVTARLSDLRIERAEWLGAKLVAESTLHALLAVLDAGTEDR